VPHVEPLNRKQQNFKQEAAAVGKLAFDFQAILSSILDKPTEMLDYAGEQMERVRGLLQAMPAYTCPSSCKLCCHGSILMSYVEYVHILHRLRENYNAEKLLALFSRRLGVLEEADKLLCPFVEESKEAEHCAIYHDRPLICRVYGTTAAPCAAEIEQPHFPAGAFYQAYNLLYYLADGSFIGLPLSDGLALFEAPFPIWAAADSDKVEEVLSIFAEHGSMRAVICDVPANRFFTILPGGERHYLA